MINVSSHGGYVTTTANRIILAQQDDVSDTSLLVGVEIARE